MLGTLADPDNSGRACSLSKSVGQSAAMCDVAQGEQNSPIDCVLECFRMQAGAETPEGCLARSPQLAGEECEAERTLIDTLGRRRLGE